MIGAGLLIWQRKSLELDHDHAKKLALTLPAEDEVECRNVLAARRLAREGRTVCFRVASGDSCVSPEESGACSPSVSTICDLPASAFEACRMATITQD